MSDLIDRRAAMDAIADLYWMDEQLLNFKREINAVYDKVLNLPSADPGLDEWCPDCKEYDQKRHCCPRFNKVIRGTLADMKAQKTGKWETIEGWDGDVLYQCSECGTEFVLIDGTPEENDYRFCPHCGADMRGEEDG